MKKKILIFLCFGAAAVFFAGCAPNTVLIKDVSGGGKELFSYGSRDPGEGVLVQAGNALLEIEIYKDVSVRKDRYNWQRTSKLLYQVVLQPASLGRGLETRGNRVVSISEQWLNLEPGHYTLLIYPSRGIGPFKRQFPRQTRWLSVDNDPNDHIYKGAYVGWVERFEISDYATTPGFEFQFDLNQIK